MLVPGQEVPGARPEAAEERLAERGDHLGTFRSRSGVREGPEHPRDVLQRRMLGAALRQWTGGLAFEIEHQPLAFAAHHLAQV